MSCAASSCLVLSCLVLLRLVAFCRVVLSCLALSCLALPWVFFAWPCVVLLFEKCKQTAIFLCYQTFCYDCFLLKSCESLFFKKLKLVKNSFAKKHFVNFFLLKQVSSKILPSLALPCHGSPCPALSCSSCLVWRSGLYRGWLRQLLFWMLAVRLLHAPCCQLVSLSLGQLKRRATR